MTTTDSTFPITDQEWCPHCCLDIDTEPGVGRDVLFVSFDPKGATSFVHLACGHVLDVQGLFEMTELDLGDPRKTTLYDPLVHA